MKVKMLLVVLVGIVGSVAITFTSYNASAASCNPRADVHQRKASALNWNLENISKEELEFLLCMTPEKEDRENLTQIWEKGQAQRRAFEEQQRKERAAEAERQQKERAAEAERQQREKERAEKIAREDAAREAQAEHLVVSIEGIGKDSRNIFNAYYLGRVTPDDVVLIEPLRGSYSSVYIMVPRKPILLAKPGISVKHAGADYSLTWKTSGPVRVKVRDLLEKSPMMSPYHLEPGKAVDAMLAFDSYDNMQIRATILCVPGEKNPPCRNRTSPETQKEFSGSSNTNTIGEWAKRINLSGLWEAYGYTCPGSVIVPVEKIRIKHAGSSVIATKDKGDDCIRAGEITFKGEYDGGKVPNTVIIKIQVAPSGPNTTERRYVDAFLEIMNLNSLQLVYGDTKITFNRTE